MPEKINDLSTLPINYIGLFFYYCMPFRKKIIQNNINIVYKNTISHNEKQRLIISFYSHIARSIKEFTSPRSAIMNEILGLEYLLQAASKGKGVLLLAPHIGNWEVACAKILPKITMYKNKFNFIRKPISNIFIKKLLFKNFENAGINIILKKGALKKSLNLLKKEHAIFFVLDQHASVESKEGIPVEFFGKKAGTYSSLAAMALLTKAPVVPAITYRDKIGHHVIEFSQPLEWIDYPSSEEAIYQNTLIYNQVLEKNILAHPEQWYWFHRRWKL